MDKLCNDAILRGLTDKEYIDSLFPFEQVVVMAGKMKVIGSPRRAFYEFWGSRTACALFHSKCIVSKYNFNLIFWNGVDKVMKGFPLQFQIWVTKKVSHFCGTNKQQHWMDPQIDHHCPSCNERQESVAHITHCFAPGQVEMFHESVDTLVQWA